MDQEHWEFHIWNGDIMGVTSCPKTAHRVAEAIDGLVAIMVICPILFQGLKPSFSEADRRNGCAADLR